MEAPGALVGTRFPSVIVPVCVVSKCVYTSMVKCVLQRAHRVGARACVRATPCAKETLGMSETPCVEATPCVSGMVASVPGCMLPSTPCVSETLRVSVPACVSGMVCVKETARVCEQPCGSEARCVRGTACVRSLYVMEMTVGMREHAAASPGVSVMVRCVSLVTRGSLSACVEWR